MRNGDEKTVFKAAVKQAFLSVLQQRMHTARQAMEEAQASANSQEKSSAGDKFETSRAMGQIDRDMNAVQLLQAREEFRILESLSPELHQQVSPGSIIELSTGIFYAAVGLGQLKIGPSSVFAISCKSPLFDQLKRKLAGDKIIFRNQELEILDVY